MADVAGLQVDEFAPDIRHVRDMWHGASNGNQLMRRANLDIGNLLVTSRRYNLDRGLVEIPGHVGIVTGIGEVSSFIHASPRAGKVEERPLKALDTMLGSIAVTLE